MRNIQFVVAIIAAAAAAPAATAAQWPQRPVRMLVGFAPGGGTDATARAIAPKLSELAGPAGRHR